VEGSQYLKRCARCKRGLAPGEFQKNRSKTDGLQSYCRRCWNEYEHQRRQDNIEEHRKTGRTAARRHRLKKNFGLTEAEYDRMLEGQNGLCAICGQAETARWKGRTIRLGVDHCYQTGRVRGLLCNQCNRALGCFKDSVDYLRSAIAYLEA
jgi:hypothetical protein